MINTPEELEVGKLCWLYPQTKTASANVHSMRAVHVLKDPKAHWPMVVVGWNEDGVDRWELVHRDNIRKRSPAARNRADEREGDTVGETRSTKPGRVRVMPNAKKYAPTDGQETLF